MIKITVVKILCGFVLYSQSVTAITLSDLPMEPIYFEPPIIKEDESVQQLTCIGLDKAINQQLLLHYNLE